MPCNCNFIVNDTYSHNPKAKVIGLTGEEIFRPQLKTAIKKLWRLLFTLNFFFLLKISASSNTVCFIVCLESLASRILRNKKRCLCPEKVYPNLKL